MTDAAMVYGFIALMVFNLLATFIYVFGLTGLGPAFKKALIPIKRR